MIRERTTTTRPPAPKPRSARAWVSLAVIAGGLFLAVMSTTLVGVALPSIGTGLHASPVQLEWILDAYVIVYSSLLVAGGVLGDRWGRKGLFIAGVATFGTGSLVAGLAPTVRLLVTGRALQGLGPALLVPCSLAIIRAIFADERRRAVAIGLWSTASGLALAVGPALGGLLVDGLGWRWAFLFNVPLGAVLVAMAGRWVPRLPTSPVSGRFDWLGALLTTAAVALLAYSTIDGPTGGWVSAPVVGAFVLGIGALVALVVWEHHAVEPLIDVRLFTRPSFVAANLAAFVVFFAFVGVIVYMSAYFQQVRGDSAVMAGLDVSAIGAAFALAASRSGRLVARFGPGRPMLVGLVVAGAATLGLLRLDLDTGEGAIWWNFAILGAGIGMSLTPMTTVAMSAVEADRAGMVSAVHNALRQLGQVFGVAVLGALVYADLTASATAVPFGRTAASHFLDGLHSALRLSGLALFAAAGLAAVLLMLRPATDDNRRRER